MSPASFSVRPRSKRRFIPPIVVGLLVVAAVLVYIGSRGGTGGPRVLTKDEEPVTFAFATKSFKPIFEGKRPQQAAIAAERSAIEAMFTAYYLKAFVDPGAWKDPTFAEQAALFTPEARASFAKDVAALTIGDGARDVTKVNPSATSLTTSVYFDRAGTPTYAVAAVSFKARAVGIGDTIDLVQSATYRLQKTGSTWVIFSYEANAKQDTPPSPSPSPSVTAS